jgi:hypothetical protein
MKKNNFFSVLMLATSFSAVLTACNNESGDKKDDSKKPADTTVAKPVAAVTTPAPAGPTVPFDAVTINHTVKDYSVWRSGFDGNDAVRKASGLSVIAVERSAGTPNDLKVVLQVTDLAKAKAFIADPALKEVMGKAGVISKPVVNYWHVVRASAVNSATGDNLVEIVHKVKDFDAWLKVYDEEGAATRAANGMVDDVIARGIDDPNLVHIVFAVTDVAKAKARLADPALGKIMMNAGVTGKPAITFYTDATK